MARILVVKHLFPYPPSQGTRRVSLALLEDLAARHEVVFLCQLEDPAEQGLIPHIERLGVRVHAPLMPNRRSPVHRLLYKARNRTLARLRRIPEICLYASNRELRGGLERIEREFEPDLTILESWETYLLRRSIHCGRAALLAHDAGFQIIERAIGATTDPRERDRRRRRLEREKRLEIHAWTLFDAILTLTAADRETVAHELEHTPDTARVHPPLVRHLPVPVSAEFFRFGRPAVAGRRVGFLGSFRADFNRDALCFILEDIWPRVAERLPGAELIIAGNGADPGLAKRAGQSGARWLGLVEDLAEFFAAIDVLLVPLRFGAGVRIRILEALAAATAVVATPLAAAGLNVTPGEHLLLGSDAEALATQIAWVCEHPAEAAGLGRRGRQWCARLHGPEALRDGRLAIIDEILALRS
ncbi:MAG: glycosyltransferase [Candidatus Eisenbacteria bacterium]